MSDFRVGDRVEVIGDPTAQGTGRVQTVNATHCYVEFGYGWEWVEQGKLALVDSEPAPETTPRTVTVAEAYEKRLLESGELRWWPNVVTSVCKRGDGYFTVWLDINEWASAAPTDAMTYTPAETPRLSEKRLRPNADGTFTFLGAPDTVSLQARIVALEAALEEIYAMKIYPMPDQPNVLDHMTYAMSVMRIARKALGEATDVDAS